MNASPYAHVHRDANTCWCVQAFHTILQQPGGPTCLGLDAEWRPKSLAAGTGGGYRRSESVLESDSENNGSSWLVERERSVPLGGGARWAGREERNEGGRGRIAVLQLASEDVVLVLQLEHATRAGALKVPQVLRDHKYEDDDDVYFTTDLTLMMRRRMLCVLTLMRRRMLCVRTRQMSAWHANWTAAGAARCPRSATHPQSRRRHTRRLCSNP